MTVRELCEKIDMPPQTVERIAACRRIDKNTLAALQDMSTAQAAYLKLKADDDRHGIYVLSNYLHAALLSYEKYKALDVGDGIFFDTMACLSRFVREYGARYGEYGFDRGWWAYRQLSLTIFRLGALEYEYCDAEKSVYIHIPSGADIELNECRASYEAFTQFTQNCFAKRSEYKTVLESWLISPALDALLPENSKIRMFKNCFEIESWNKADNDFLIWVYGDANIEPNALPEKTSLQRSIKRFIIGGGKVGSAFGVLKHF